MSNFLNVSFISPTDWVDFLFSSDLLTRVLHNSSLISSGINGSTISRKNNLKVLVNNEASLHVSRPSYFPLFRSFLKKEIDVNLII